jgi:hypothetical protein
MRRPPIQLGIARPNPWGRLAVVPLDDPRAMPKLDVALRVSSGRRPVGRGREVEVRGTCEHLAIAVVGHNNF